MRLGLQVSYFSWPGSPASIGPTFGADRPGRGGRRHRVALGHGPLLPDPRHRPAGARRCSRATPRWPSPPARPSRIELGTLVTGVTYRHPGLLAKTVTTLDVLSGGRAWLGIGAAWNEQEHRGLGVPFPPVGERFERLEETLQICPRCGAATRARTPGSTTCSTGPLNVPQPAPPSPADPHRRQGREEDAAPRGEVRRRLQLLRRRPEGLAHKCEVLRGHCAEWVATTTPSTRRC